MKPALAEPPKEKALSNAQAVEPPRTDLTGLQFYCGLTVLLFFACVLDFALSIYWMKFSRAEVFFADCARAMIQTQNYVTPLYRGQPFFDKPILVYWLIILMFKSFGLTHLAARVPSILASLISVAVTAQGASALFSRRAGLLAAAMLASSFMFFSFSALCMSDMLLVMFDVLTLTCLYAGLQSEERRGLFWFLAAASLGSAFLTKGPVGIVLPILSTLAFMTVTGQLKKLKPKYVLTGSITALLIASPWFIAAYNANGWDALVYFFVHENVQRFAGTAYDAHRPIWYTLVSLLTGFAPWSVFLPLAVIEFFRKGRDLVPGFYRNKQLFLWTWIMVVVGFFSISKGKCDYYTLPAFPAAAMLCANYFDRHMTAKGSTPKWSPINVLLYLFAGSLLVSSIGIAFVSQTIIGGEWGDWIGAPLVLGFASLVVFLATSKERQGAAVGASFAAICCGGALLCAQLLPAVLKNVPVEKYAAIINAQQEGIPVTVDKSLYTWADEISFQTSRRVTIADDTASLLQHLKADGKQMIVLDQNALDNLPSKERLKMTILSRDYAITKPLTPGLVMQTGGKMLSSVPVLLVANYK